MSFELRVRRDRQSQVMKYCKDCLYAYPTMVARDTSSSPWRDYAKCMHPSGLLEIDPVDGSENRDLCKDNRQDRQPPLGNCGPHGQYWNPIPKP